MNYKKKNIGVNWYYAKNSYYFSLESVCALGEPDKEEFVYVVPEWFDLRRQYIKNLEFRNAQYGMDVEKQIAQTRERTFTVASTALWDSPV